MNDAVMEYLKREELHIVERLLQFVHIPSVSTDPAFANGMVEAQELLEGWLERAGLTNVQRLEAGGHAAVYGEWLDAGGDRPTLLVYGHYDVQPPDPIDQWISPPFEPDIRDGRIYGRGVSDDKGPSIIALESIAAVLKIDGQLPVNVKVMFEGEEELGSPTLGAILKKYRKLLRADAVISADGASWRPDLVTVNTGSRGNAGFEVTVRTAAKDLHSGRFGGAVPNALHVMADMIASLHAPDGSVAVDGFYEDVREMSDVRLALKDIPFDESVFFQAIGATPLGEPAHTTLERLWLRPCLDVNGMWGGYTQPGGKTVIPHLAHAKITIRTVPDQDPVLVVGRVKDHLVAACPTGCEVSFGAERGHSPAYELPLDHPLLHAVESALTEAHGSRPHRIRIGGTLPMAAIVKAELGVDTVMLSFSIADEDFHAPNEFFRLSSIGVGLRAWTALWTATDLRRNWAD